MNTNNNLFPRSRLRNIGIAAHIDAGKTVLVTLQRPQFVRLPL
jgi:translation elongation factor EF-G